MDAQAAPQNPTDDQPTEEMFNFFPHDWRTISDELYDYCADEAKHFCPDDHRLVWMFDLALYSLTAIHKEIRQLGANLPASTLYHLAQVQSMLSHQLRIMQSFTGLQQKLHMLKVKANWNLLKQ